MESITYSLIIPVYRNEASVGRLLRELQKLRDCLGSALEVVFIVDGSPDRSFQLLQEELSKNLFPAQLLSHSRNFGSFIAIRNGLIAARGRYFCVMAADLQEPISLPEEMFKSLSADECDVAVGERISRDDSWPTRISSEIFWWFYRRLVVPEMPKGGVDVFACNCLFKDTLLELEESRSSLVALLFWLGFRRKCIKYKRKKREEGKSAWTFGKKLGYLSDSVFAFTDLPIRALVRLGAIGVALSVIVGLIVGISRLMGLITVSGYSAIVIAICFFGALNLLSTGLVGTYAWRAYENTKKRPLGIVSRKIRFGNDKP